MAEHGWVREFPGKVEVCDKNGVMLEMNNRALELEGRELIGTNILDCHPEPARTKLKQMLENGESNVYTIEKNGKRRLIYQAPWYIDGQYAGFVELGLDIPDTLPHFIRKG